MRARPSRSPPRGPAAWESQSAGPGPAQLRALNSGARPAAPLGDQEAQPRAGAQRSDRRGVRGAGVHGREGRPDQQVPAGFLPHGPATCGQRAQQRLAEGKGSATAEEGLRRRGSQGMGRGRDAGCRVPGPQGPATFRALRLAARVRRACAPTRRDVTATAGPHVGLFGSRQAPPLHSSGACASASAWLAALPPGSESA